MPERDKKKSGPEAGARAVAAPSEARAGAWDYLKELPKLNRHWYRRCLDDLGRSLQETGASPTVAELERLCDRVITTFLRSITSQAPDSEAPQFPADRVYFIPFEGDRAGKFNFAKPYYQVLDVPEALSKQRAGAGQTEGLAGSLWSCLPWFEGRVRIDPDRSVSETTEETLTFEELLSRAPDETVSGGQGDEGRGLRLRKSLLLRGDDEEIGSGRTLLRVCRHVGENGRTSSLYARRKSGTRPGREATGEDLRRLLLTALAKVFEAYRLAPGKAEIEEILGNQVDLLRWLADLSGLTSEVSSDQGASGVEEQGGGATDEELISLSSAEKDFRTIRGLLLRGYFLGEESSDPSTREVCDLLGRWVESEEAKGRSDRGESELDARKRPTAADVAHALSGLFDRREKLGSAPFFVALRQRLEEAEQKENDAPSVVSPPGRRASDAGTDPRAAQTGEITEDQVETFLDELGKHLESFTSYFLRAQRELDLEARVRTSGRDDPRRAGTAEASFVWVCPDFEDLTASLPSGSTAGLGAREISAIQAGRKDITKPYRFFFRRFEAEILSRHSSAISNYWRMQGQAAREERLFCSFDDAKAKLKQPPGIIDRKLLEDPYPQNMFLRVRICDSLNEPVIDGLFVLSTDFDEVTVWNKFGATRTGRRRDGDDAATGERAANAEDVRSDDIQDLLAFAKVFFFIVRDYLHGLDRAREAADIGLLNQFLYDKRLTHLEQRLQADLTKEGERSSAPLTDDKRWRRIVDKVLNNYAYSLLDKPEDVRNETFPYDRLLLVPLEEVGGQADREEESEEEAARKLLPFYLFQSIFVDCEDGEIQGTHYSLVKPFQSPVERLGLSPERFRSRSFQKVYEVDGEEIRLPNYLEKHYVGALRQAADGGDESWVVKVSEEDRDGREWARRALRGFWRERVAGMAGEPVDQEAGHLTTEGARTFIRFLSRLTRDLEDIDRRRPVDLRQAVLRFLLRFSLLRALIRCLEPGDDKSRQRTALAHLEEYYRDKELKLKFDDAQDLDVVSLARGVGAARAQAGESRGVDIVERLRSGGEQRREADEPLPDPFSETAFDSFSLGSDEPFLVSLLHYFSDRVREMSEGSEVAEDNTKSKGSPTTWYQPLLTRPVNASRKPNETLAARLEQVVPSLDRLYDTIAAGEDALSFFLGTVCLEVGQGQGQRNLKRLRCLVAMIRDFDDSRGSLYLSEKDLEERLEGDRKDLTLFTQTFFKSAQRNLNVARERQQVRVLTEEIQDIARSWYSQGMDAVVRDLREGNARLFQRAAVPQLDRLQPETMESLFKAAVEILCQEQATREGRPIKLESFPFDRILHVPILFGVDEAACFSYARTAPEEAKEDRESPYDLIRRRGRSELLSQGRKRPVDGQPRHLYSASLRADPELVERVRSLQPVLEILASPRFADSFRRRLYQADPRQTLAIAGTVHHLLRMLQAVLDEEKESKEKRERKEPQLPDHLHELLGLMEEVLLKNVESIEQIVSAQREKSVVRTAVFMDQAVTLDRLKNEASKVLELEETNQKTPRSEALERKIQRCLEDLERIPVLADLFREIEGGEEKEEWLYGLVPDGTRSKVFYVYYSFPPPEGFVERFKRGGRPFYHGVFCLVLDDVSTDDKLGDKDAEAADQADIGTFFHNVIDRLRLVLELQAWRYRLRRSSTDQTATGLLHRLKNELNEPAKAFAFLDTALREDNGINEQKAALLDRIRRAQESIGEVRKTFTQLRGFSDKQQGSVPRQTFSAGFIGWKLVEGLCAAAGKEIDRDGGVQSPVSEMRRTLEAIKQEAEEAKDRELRGIGAEHVADPGIEHQRIQRALHRLGDVLQGILSASGHEVELILSFVVYTRETFGATLRIRGSYRLEEALNILAENAFQAAWGRLQKQLDAGKAPDPVQVRMVCRSVAGGEVLLEIINSGEPLTNQFKEDLNAEVAQPIRGRRYSRSGAKKHGGSGFGHYFARQIVSETCGGRQAGKKLDIEIDNVEAGEGRAPSHLVRVLVNLLEARPANLRKVSVDGVLKAAERVVGKRPEVRSNGPKTGDENRPRECWLAEDIEPGEVFQAMRSVLEADRQRKQEKLLSFLRDDLLPTVELGPRELAGDLRESASHLIENASAKNKSRARLEQLVRELDALLSESISFEELEEWLEGWRERKPQLIEQVVANGPTAQVPMLAHQLERWLREGGFSPLDLLTPADHTRLENTWQSFEPFVRTEHGVEVLLEILDEHRQEIKGSKTVPECVRRLFKARDLAPAYKTADGHLEITFELPDVDLKDVEAVEASEVPNLSDEFPGVPLAPAFLQYQRSIAEGSRKGKENGNGGGGALLLSRRLDPSREAGPCQVMSRIGTVRLSMAGAGEESPAPK